jgi:hypothetical protein
MHVLRLTIRETAQAIQRQFGGALVPDWKLRRVVDAMESTDAISVQRVGTYRTIADSDVSIIASQLQQLGWIRTEVSSCK